MVNRKIWRVYKAGEEYYAYESKWHSFLKAVGVRGVGEPLPEFKTWAVKCPLIDFSKIIENELNDNFGCWEESDEVDRFVRQKRVYTEPDFTDFDR